MGKIKQFKTKAPAWLLLIRDDYEETYYEISPTAYEGRGLIIIYARNWNEANDFRDKAEKEFKAIRINMIENQTTAEGNLKP